MLVNIPWKFLGRYIDLPPILAYIYSYCDALEDIHGVKNYPNQSWFFFSSVITLFIKKKYIYYLYDFKKKIKIYVSQGYVIFN